MGIQEAKHYRARAEELRNELSKERAEYAQYGRDIDERIEKYQSQVTDLMRQTKQTQATAEKNHAAEMNVLTTFLEDYTNILNYDRSVPEVRDVVDLMEKYKTLSLEPTTSSSASPANTFKSKGKEIAHASDVESSQGKEKEPVTTIKRPQERNEAFGGNNKGKGRAEEPPKNKVRGQLPRKPVKDLFVPPGTEGPSSRLTTAGSTASLNRTPQGQARYRPPPGEPRTEEGESFEALQHLTSPVGLDDPFVSAHLSTTFSPDLPPHRPHPSNTTALAPNTPAQEPLSEESPGFAFRHPSRRHNPRLLDIQSRDVPLVERDSRLIYEDAFDPPLRPASSSYSSSPPLTPREQHLKKMLDRQHSAMRTMHRNNDSLLEQLTLQESEIAFLRRPPIPDRSAARSRPTTPSSPSLSRAVVPYDETEPMPALPSFPPSPDLPRSLLASPASRRLRRVRGPVTPPPPASLVGELSERVSPADRTADWAEADDEEGAAVWEEEEGGVGVEGEDEEEEGEGWVPARSNSRLLQDIIGPSPLFSRDGERRRRG